MTVTRNITKKGSGFDQGYDDSRVDHEECGYSTVIVDSVPFLYSGNARTALAGIGKWFSSLF
jgi:hypothetical protein